MVYEDDVREHLTDLRLQLQDLKKRGEEASEAVGILEERVERLERRLRHKGGME